MLSLEFCKRLKEAAYPLADHSFYDDFASSSDICYDCRAYDEQDTIPWCVPTLEELIEACGKEFIGVQRNPFPRPESWCASASKEDGGINLFGNSPEEAVANLWLRLHEK